LIDGDTRPYCFQILLHGKKYENRNLNQRELNQKVQLKYKAYCAYTGRFTLGGREYLICLEDRNANGVFYEEFTPPRRSDLKERTAIPHRGDTLYLTTGDRFGSYDARICAGWFLLGDGIYQVSVDFRRNVMILNPLSQRVYPLELPDDPLWLTLYREGGPALIMDHPGREIRVPRGGYYLLNYVLHREDEQGDLWRASCKGTKESPCTTVGPGRNAIVEFGEPYRPVADVAEAHRMNPKQGKKKVPLRLLVIGSGEEIMDDLQHIRGDKTEIVRSKKRKQRPKEATYRILKETGDVVAQGEFEYG
jgi:hypothetical protein